VGESMRLSIVVPVFNSQDTLDELVLRLSAVAGKLQAYEIILVNDCSRDGSDRVCKSLCEKFPEVKYISFYKNFGQICAIMAGLRESTGELAVILDDDLQNPPEEIPKLLEAMEKGYDFVFGISEQPQKHRLRVTASRLTFILADLMLDKPPGLRHSSFLALRRGT